MQSNQKDEQNHFPSCRRMPRLTSRIEPKKLKVVGGKRKVTETSANQKELPELTNELLELIAKRLDVVGFCAFGGVCKNWWEIYATCKQEFLESQAPMAVLISTHAKRACYLYDMANANTKRVVLSTLVGKFFLGCTAGYIIIEDMNRLISLINPLTGSELNFCTPPFTLKGNSLHDLIVFIPILSSASYFIVAVANYKHEIQIFNSSNSNWFTALYFGQRLVDIAIFKNKVFVVTRKARFGELKIKASYSEVSWLEVRNTPNVNSHNLKLVVSNNQLLMVDFAPKKHLNIFKLDFDSMEWIRLDKLGDQALFYGGKWGSTIRKPGKWNGQSNCVYCLEALSSMCCVYSMKAELIDKFSLVENPATSKLYSHGWYYPHQCMKEDYLMEHYLMED